MSFIAIEAIWIIEIGLSYFGSIADKAMNLVVNNMSSSSIYSTICLLIAFVPIFLMISGIFRYVFLSYYELERSLLVKTKYYPEFFIVSVLVPIARLIYPYLFLRDLKHQYSIGIETKEKKSYIIFTISLFTVMIYSQIIDFFGDGTINLVRKSNIFSVLGFVVFSIIGILLVATLNDLFDLQKEKMESYYS